MYFKTVVITDLHVKAKVAFVAARRRTASGTECHDALT